MNFFVKGISLCLFTFGLLSNAHAILPIEKLDSYKGAKAYLVQTKALPMVDIEVSIDAGDRYDPAGKSGLADMVAGLMNYGVRGEKGVLTEAQMADEIINKIKAFAPGSVVHEFNNPEKNIVFPVLQFKE